MNCLFRIFPGHARNETLSLAYIRPVLHLQPSGNVFMIQHFSNFVLNILNTKTLKWSFFGGWYLAHEEEYRAAAAFLGLGSQNNSWTITKL